MLSQQHPPFIGMGANPEPDVPDIPLGLGMALAQDPEAMNGYGNLNSREKTDLISYIQASQTGADAKQRIASVVKNLKAPGSMPGSF